MILSAMEQNNVMMMRAMNMAGTSSATLGLLRDSCSRDIRTLPRYGCFWESEVPNISDAFFKESFRLEREVFNILVKRLTGMRKKDISLRAAVPAEKRIAIALYTLGSSADYRTVGRLFGVSKAFVCVNLFEFCREVIGKLAQDYLPANFLTQDKIVESVKGFEELGFPQCFAAMDSCHIEVRPRSEHAVNYRNSKGWYSTVLFALVDHRYRFTYISVGSPGRCHDSKIFETSTLKRKLFETDLLEDNAKTINGVEVPVLILGDSAFKFSTKVMKPYPFSMEATPQERLLNYNLTKTRRVVENAFGHLKARFRRIGKGLDNRIDKTCHIIACCCILHNFCNMHNSSVNDNWQSEAQNAHQNDQPELENMNPSAETIRQALAINFLSNNSI